MENCEEKFEQQDVLDSRIRIVFDPEDGNFSFIHRDMNYPQVREVVKRIANALRTMDILPGFSPRKMSFVSFPDFGDGKFVCIAFNPDTDEIQVSIQGLKTFDTCMACDHVAAYIDAVLFAPHTVEEIAQFYGAPVQE